jgi:hypothetical protein
VRRHAAGADHQRGGVVVMNARLVKALTNLLNEANAIAEMARPCIGNTNVACLLNRCVEASAALAEAEAQPGPPCPLTDEQIEKIGETLGAKVPGHSDFDSWGHGYRADDTGAHTIPVLPANLVPFARAVLAAAGVSP